MEPPNLSLTIFFPCHNEEGNIERVIQQALAVARPLCSDLQIVIVNDGSRDRTAQIADRLAKQHAEVQVVHHPVNRGYGGALQSGFQSATKEWIFYTDGDGQFDICELIELLPLRDQRTVVSAYRKNRQDSLLRRFNGWCWNKLVNVVFKLDVRDIDCAFKLYPANLFTEIELRSTGALLDTEILAKASRLGYRIVQVGVSHYPRLEGRQSGADFKVIVRAFKELFQLRRHILEQVPKRSPGS